VLPSDTSWLIEPTTGVHQFGGGSQRWCTGCHVVSGDQVKGTDLAPSFASIAERPDYNVEKLASFLLEPHPKMPNMALSPEDAKDISAFIAEQRRK
jgi:mono/diheme cytochrome c family protein